ncbi:hypothetical protein [Halosimplex sp. TS25]|uniref:hypothetical protein n=1 Tax=Halosimplex rarum TaxID=3396619 RepID=UPI0039E9A217
MTVQDAKSVLNDEVTGIDSYLSGYKELSYFFEYSEMCSNIIRLVETWKHGRPIIEYQFETNLSELYWDVHQAFTQFTISTHTAIESLTTSLLSDRIDPGNQSLSLKTVDELSQHHREQILAEEGLIEGNFSNKLNQFRGKRNIFAHDWGSHFEFEEHTDPVEYVDEGIGIVEKLVEMVYGSSLQNIVSFIEESQMEPSSKSIREWTSFQLIRCYLQEYSWHILIDANVPGTSDKKNIENLEKVLERRGFDPEKVRDRGLYRRRGSSRKGHLPAEGSILIESNFEVPQSTICGNNEDLEIEFEVDNDIHLPIDGQISELEQYAVLFIDGVVEDKCPVEGAQTVTPGEQVNQTLSYEFKSVGEIETKLGLVFSSENNHSTQVLREYISVCE